MADDALDQVLAQVLALADPDAQAAIGGTHQHPAPFAPVLEHLVLALRRHLGQLRRIAERASSRPSAVQTWKVS